MKQGAEEGDEEVIFFNNFFSRRTSLRVLWVGLGKR